MGQSISPKGFVMAVQLYADSSIAESASERSDAYPPMGLLSLMLVLLLAGGSFCLSFLDVHIMGMSGRPQRVQLLRLLFLGQCDLHGCMKPQQYAEAVSMTVVGDVQWLPGK